MKKKSYLIIGGVRSGKSEYAQSLAKRLSSSVIFLATAQARDDEMKDRIREHQKKRPKDWQTIEEPLNLAMSLKGLIKKAEVILIDCLTIFISNHLLSLKKDQSIKTAKIRIQNELTDLFNLYSDHSASLIIVTNEVGMGVVPATPLGRSYRDLLGWANKYIAQRIDHLILLIAGIPIDIKQIYKTQQSQLI